MQKSGVGANVLMSAHFSRLAAREMGLREKDLGDYLAGSGISTEAFLRDDLLITKDQQVVIAMNAIRLSGDAGFGLRFGRRLTPEAYGPLGFLVSASPNLSTALEHLKTFLPTRVPFIRLENGVDDHRACCRILLNYSDHPVMQRIEKESIALSLVAILETVGGTKLENSQMFFDYPAPPYADRYDQFFNIPISFSAAATELVFPPDLLTISNPIANTNNYRAAMQQCQSMLNDMPDNETTTRSRVQKLLLSSPPGSLNEPEVARQLFLSTRTLSRRLQSENTSFRKLQNDILASIAAHQLTTSQDSLDTIAASLNYYDSANFRRAFIGWYGVSPEQFRKGLRGHAAR